MVPAPRTCRCHSFPHSAGMTVLFFCILCPWSRILRYLLEVGLWGPRVNAPVDFVGCCSPIRRHQSALPPGGPEPVCLSTASPAEHGVKLLNFCQSDGGEMAPQPGLPQHLSYTSKVNAFSCIQGPFLQPFGETVFLALCSFFSMIFALLFLDF